MAIAICCKYGLCIVCVGKSMRREYDFANMKGRRNPHAKGCETQVTLRLGVDVIEYFKALAEETGTAVRRHIP